MIQARKILKVNPPERQNITYPQVFSLPLLPVLQWGHVLLCAEDFDEVPGFLEAAAKSNFGDGVVRKAKE